MPDFYDREMEMEALQQHWDSDKAEFALLYGRRRLGKTFLLQRFFGEGKKQCYYLAAQSSLHTNLVDLASSVINASSLTGYKPADLPTLNSILRFVSNNAQSGRFALVLDEFQYLLEQDHSIPSQIQAWWDTEGIRSNVFLVLCGSHLGMMEGLGGSQAPLFRRFTFRYKLPPMTYIDISRFYSKSDYTIRDKLIAFGILGGTPRYHSLFEPRYSLESNVTRHILSPIGLLRNEPEVLMLSSQVRDPAPYNAIISALVNGNTRPNEIKQVVGCTSSQLTFYLKNLLDLEWIEKEMPFGETSERRAIYKVRDHFIKFHYRFVDKYRSELDYKNYKDLYRTNIRPYLNDYMGLHAFEDICHQYLRINGNRFLDKQIRKAGRYWSRDGSIEIDVVAELDDASLVIGECKWSSSPAGVSVYYSLMEKVSRVQIFGNRKVRFMLFSTAGFDDNMVATAERDGILLITGDDLLA